MTPQKDVLLLSDEELKTTLEELEHHRRLASGDFGNVKKARKRKEVEKEARSLGEFTPEKAAALELAQLVLATRSRAMKLLGEAKTRVPAAPAPTTDTVDAYLVPKAPTFPSTDVVERKWESNYARIVEKEKEGTYGPRSAMIWQGLQAMHAELHWYPWGGATMQQDHTSKPIIFHIDPKDNTLSGENYGISSRMGSPGLNAHGAQRYLVSDGWAGMAMVRALSLHLVTNNRLDETRAFMSSVGIEDPAYNRLEKEISDDGTAVYMHATEHASGGKFFDTLSRLLTAKGVFLLHDLHGRIEMRHFLEEARQLDPLFTDEPPRSRAEVLERLNAYGHGIAFRLLLNAAGPGEHFTSPGSFHNQEYTVDVSDDAVRQYLRMFDRKKNVQQPVEPPPETARPAEKPLAELTLEWWERARDALAHMHGHERKPERETVESLRRILQLKTKPAIRIFEAVTAIDAWKNDPATAAFSASFLRHQEETSTDGDVLVLREGIKRLVDTLKFQAFHDERIKDLTIPEMQELLLVVIQAVRHAGMRMPVTHEEEEHRFVAAAALSIDSVYAALRESGSSNVRSAIEDFRAVARTRGMPQRTLSARDVAPELHAASNGIFEVAEIEALALRLRGSMPASPRERKTAAAALGTRKHPFTYVADDGERLALAHDPNEIAARTNAAVFGKTIRHGGDHMLVLPRAIAMPVTGVGVAIDGSGAVYGQPAILSALTQRKNVIVPETWAKHREGHLSAIKDSLPAAIQEKSRQMDIVCPGMPEEIRGKTVFVEDAGSLYARCPSPEVAAWYGETINGPSLPPNREGWVTVRLKTIAELEADYLKGERMAGRFFQGEAGDDAPKPGVSDASSGTQGTPAETREFAVQRRLRAVRDVLLRNRIPATFSFDAATTDAMASEREEAFDFTRAPDGHWVIVDLPVQKKQLFVSDNPERTYAYGGNQPIGDYLQENAPTPRQLQQRGAKQIFWHSVEQFEASITQAITTETWSNADAGSVEVLIERHGAYVRERLEALVAHVNAQPARAEKITLTALKFGTLREGVRSGKAEREPHCGHTIVKDLARMAGYQDPIPYKTLREFFDLVIEGMGEDEPAAENAPGDL